jgi:hypothetical protein
MKSKKQIQQQIKQMKKCPEIPIKDGASLYVEALEWVLED